MVSSSNVEEMIEWRPVGCFQADQERKPNKEETTIDRRDPLCTEIPEWLHKFREILVDDEIPVHGDSHASSSHEVSLEPTFKRREDLVKHIVYTYFLKDRNCEICKRAKITRAPCRRRNGGAVPRAEFWWLDDSDGHPMDPVKSVLNNNFSGNAKGTCKFLKPDRNPEVIYTDNSLKFGKACEDLSWNHCTSTPHRSEINGFCRKRSAQSEGRHLCCSVATSLNESSWADAMECYTYLRNVTDLLPDGKTPYERRFGNPLEGPIIPSITLWLRRTSQESINLERKSYLGCSSNLLCTRWECGKVTHWSQTLRSWKRWTHRNYSKKTQCEKSDISRRKKENSCSQSQMDESKPLEEIRTWEHQRMEKSSQSETHNEMTHGTCTWKWDACGPWANAVCFHLNKEKQYNRRTHTDDKGASHDAFMRLKSELRSQIPQVLQVISHTLFGMSFSVCRDTNSLAVNELNLFIPGAFSSLRSNMNLKMNLKQIGHCFQWPFLPLFSTSLVVAMKRTKRF